MPVNMHPSADPNGTPAATGESTSEDTGAPGESEEADTKANASEAPEPNGQGAAPAPSVDTQAASRFVKFLSWLIVGAYLAATIVLVVCAWRAETVDGTKWAGLRDGGWWALVFGVGVTALGLLVLQLLGGKKGYGLFRPVVGTDGRFSTSLTQLGLWTVAIGTGFGYLLGRVMFDDQRFSVVMPGSRWDQYLLLLGGPFAAAVIAKGIVMYKLDNRTLQKSEAQQAEPVQVVANDQGNADLVDSQYLLFNVIALGYFVVQLASTSKLPEIPSTLLALTGGTAAVYVANKAAERNAPSISSLSPLSAKAGSLMTIYGNNFDPGDPNNRKRRITIALTGRTETIYTDDSSDTRVRFVVPADAQPGDQELRLTSTAGVETAPHALRIVTSS